MGLSIVRCEIYLVVMALILFKQSVKYARPFLLHPLAAVLLLLIPVHKQRHDVRMFAIY